MKKIFKWLLSSFNKEAKAQKLKREAKWVDDVKGRKTNVELDGKTVEWLSRKSNRSFLALFNKETSAQRLMRQTEWLDNSK